MVRTVIIKVLGAEYLGLDGLFTSVLQVLNLSELGFGTAIVYSKYKPIANNDESTICALYALYRKIYRVVGIIILIVGIGIVPFLQHLIKGDYPSELNIYILYSIYLGNTVLSYLMFAYKNSLLSAFQREDVISKINLMTKVVLYLAQVVLVVVFENYYIYLIVLPISTLLNNILISIDVDKRFPQIVCCGRVEATLMHDIKTKVAGLMISKVCQVSRNAFDSIFISAFLGLTITAMYNNYYYIINAITGFLGIISTSLMAGVGNNVASHDAKKNYEDMCKMDYLYMLLGGWCSLCLICLIEPFMLIWVGKEYTFPLGVVVLLVVYFYALKIGDVRSIYVNAAGLWWENRFRSIMEAVANIVLNYFLGKKFGVYGIVVATLISLLVFNFFYGSRIIFKHYYKNGKHSRYVGTHFLYAAITFGVAAITYNACQYIQGNEWMVLIGRFVVCLLLPTILYFLIYRKTKIYKKTMPWLLEKFHLEKKLKFLI